MIELFGVTIHEPDVVFTDLVLALLGAGFGWRLWTGQERRLAKSGAILMYGLASAAFWGALFHGFFPDETATTPGFLAWIPVALSILIAAAAMLEISLRILLPAIPAASRRVVVAAYAAGFAGVVLLVDVSFTSIVRFYVPVLLLFLVGAGMQAVRSRSGWALIAAGLVVSAGAALLQQARVSIHPDYFDHNAVYHVLQSIALVFLYIGFRRLPAESGRAYATRADPAPRQG